MRSGLRMEVEGRGGARFPSISCGVGASVFQRHYNADGELVGTTETLRSGRRLRQRLTGGTGCSSQRLQTSCNERPQSRRPDTRYVLSGKNPQRSHLERDTLLSVTDNRWIGYLTDFTDKTL